MNTLVTGATGLLGRYLIHALLECGAGVRALVLPNEDSTWLAQRGVAVHRGDVREADTLAAPMRGVDSVFHLAGMMGVWRPLRDYYDVNVRGTENVCRAALSAGVGRLVHVSSWTVYGMGLGRIVREDFPLAPFPEPYALTKAEGDRVVQRLIAGDHLPATIVRPDTFFGPGDRLHFGRMADRLLAGTAIIVGSGRNYMPFVYVEDVVQGLMLAAHHSRAIGQAYNIASDEPLTQEALWRAMAEELGTRPPYIRIPYTPLYVAASLFERAASPARSRRQPPITRLGVRLYGTDNRHAVDKARDELGYAPRVRLQEGVRRAALWYRQQRNDVPSGVVGERREHA